MSKDRQVLGELGRQLAEIANLPIQQEKKKLWREHNGLRPCRPLVCIDQIPWHEMNVNDELTLQCEDAFLREVEKEIRRTLYMWRHFPADMVVENRIDIQKTVKGLRYGLDIKEETVALDINNNVVGHKYIDQCDSEEAVDALRPDIIEVDEDLDKQRFELCSEIFKGIIPVRLSGVTIHSGAWDRITRARSAQAILYDIADRPELLLKTAEKFRDLTISTLDQCEALGLLEAEETRIHCTGAYTDELPAPGYDPAHTRAIDCWTFGMAQIFSSVSPDTHEEFEIDVMKPLYERFGLMYYGCCEPLDRKIRVIRKIRNVRKISISPWARIDEGAEQIGRDYVFSGKAHPGYIVDGKLDEENVLGQAGQMVKACERNGTPCEIILKDLSTISYRPQVLTEWENAVMRLVGA